MRKIVFVIESLRHGGAEKSLVTLLNSIDLSNFQVDLILFQKGGEFEKHLPKNIRLVYKVAIKNTSFYTRVKYWIEKKIDTKHHTAQLFWKTYNAQTPSNKKEYDIAIAYNQGFSTYYVASKIKAKKKYAWLNTDYLKAGYRAVFDQKYYAKFDKIVAVSPEAKENILTAFKTLELELKITVIKDIIDDTIIKKRASEEKNVFPINKRRTKILTVGRLAKAKGYPLALEACQILLNKGYQIDWFVIGDGPERKEIENLITNRGISDHFHLLGFKDNPYPYINDCDIYVQTSLFEGLGMTVIEAAFLKKLIVSTNFSTIKSIITHKQTGLICDMNPKAIADSIQQYIDTPKLNDIIKRNLEKLNNTDKEKSIQHINHLLKE